MAILALDLGTRMGWAVSAHGVVVSGSYNLKPSKHDSNGMRFLRMVRFLEELRELHGIEHIGYENIRRHAGTEAAHIFGGLKAHLFSWIETLEEHIPTEAFEVGEIKKAWCGRGNASKQQMIDAARERGFQVVDDNEADALAILHMMGGGE